MPQMNFKDNFVLTRSENCVASSNVVANEAIAFAIIDKKLYIPVVTLSIQDNAKILQLLKLGFKRIIVWNKYQLKVSA